MLITRIHEKLFDSQLFEQNKKKNYLIGARHWTHRHVHSYPGIGSRTLGDDLVYRVEHVRPVKVQFKQRKGFVASVMLTTSQSTVVVLCCVVNMLFR